jgi:hypothetical protein
MASSYGSSRCPIAWTCSQVVGLPPSPAPAPPAVVPGTIEEAVLGALAVGSATVVELARRLPQFDLQQLRRTMYRLRDRKRLLAAVGYEQAPAPVGRVIRVRWGLAQRQEHP